MLKTHFKISDEGKRIDVDIQGKPTEIMEMLCAAFCAESKVLNWVMGALVASAVEPLNDSAIAAFKKAFQQLQEALPEEFPHSPNP